MSPQRIVAVIGAALLAIGSLLDWATVSTGFGEIGVAGTEGDGTLTLGAGLLALTLLLVANQAANYTGAGIAIVGTLIAVYDAWNVAEAFEESGGVVDVGIGLYICIVGGAAASIAGFFPENPRAVLSNVGWFPDPFHRHIQRYYDGIQWTEHVHDNGVASVDPPV